MTPLDFNDASLRQAIGPWAHRGDKIREQAQEELLDNALALVPLPAYDACRAALAACRSTDEVREIRDRAVALRAYARQAKDRGLEADAFEIRSRAERRLGGMLIEQKATIGFNHGGWRERQALEACGSENEPQARKATLAEAGIDKKLSMRAQRLAKLHEPEFDGVIADGRERIIAVGRERIQNALANFSGNNEWYTPPVWVERARSAMGSIDLDPASCEFAQRTVRAAEWFDRERDGLAQRWRGNIWLNPPYERGLIDKFIKKLIVDRNNFSQAVVLVDSRTDTSWFHRLCDISNAVAFPKGRINFHTEDVTSRSSPVFGSAFVYIGSRRDAFTGVFSGSCLILHGEELAADGPGGRA
jgi:ParB family chromosome partitioning protein